MNGGEKLMKRRFLVSFVMIALAALLIGGASFAIFTSTDSNAANEFNAGTLVVAAGAQEYTVSLTNMAPGDTINGSFVVSNTGSLELRFDTTANPSGVLFEGATPATVSIANPTDVVVAAGGTAVVTYTVHMPIGADNGYQNAGGTLSFTVNAEQTANN